MCGIGGAIGAADPTTRDAVARIGDAQTHRGPDASGAWTTGASSDHCGVSFVFRRLAIIDLSEGGHQPMTDPETGNVLIFNGEIYNFQDLRRELESCGDVFRSRSDTEVILRAYARWGVESFARLRGMFALALWDARDRIVLLARDRLGIKPLYIYERTLSDGSRSVLFASEVRALLATGIVPRELDPVALATYVWNGFVVGPNTIVKGVELLPSATIAVYGADGTVHARRRFWERPVAGRRAMTTDDLAARLSTAVRQHLVSDVPLGIFLSGGIDSSAIAALATRSTNATVRTFTITFDERAYDESGYARSVARALGTEHQEIRLTEREFARSLPRALGSLDQPTFDGINTYFVSRAVREAGLTVALAGTGGDELFGGYRSFRDVPWAASWARRLTWLPPGLVRATVTAAMQRNDSHGEVPPQTRWGKIGDVLSAGGDLVGTYQAASALFSSEFSRALLAADVDGAVRFGLPRDVASELRRLTSAGGSLGAVSSLEQWCFLGERLLRDTDTTSMASSLEVRVPFLDHQVVEAAAALSDEARFHPLGQKRILRDVALGDLDPRLFDRPKSGFVLPIDRWARDTLKDTITEAFSDRAFCEAAGLQPHAVQQLWTAFLGGARGIYWSRVWALYALGWWCSEHRVGLR